MTAATEPVIAMCQSVPHLFILPNPNPNPNCSTVVTHGVVIHVKRAMSHSSVTAHMTIHLYPPLLGLPIVRVL